MNRVAEIIQSSYPTANSLVAALEQLGLLEEITGQSRNRAGHAVGAVLSNAIRHIIGIENTRG